MDGWHASGVWPRRDEAAAAEVVATVQRARERLADVRRERVDAATLAAGSWDGPTADRHDARATEVLSLLDEADRSLADLATQVRAELARLRARDQRLREAWQRRHGTGLGDDLARERPARPPTRGTRAGAASTRTHRRPSLPCLLAGRG